MSYQFLVVDDTSFMRKMAADCLKQYGHIVAGEAVNGKQAVQKYKDLQPQVVMMDLTMPEMNGIEAIKEILSYDAEAVILVCSASNQKDMIQEALDAGAIGYLMKPFKPEYMNEIIKKYAEPHLKLEKAESIEETDEETDIEKDVGHAVQETEEASAEAAVTVDSVKEETNHHSLSETIEKLPEPEAEPKAAESYKAAPEQTKDVVNSPSPIRNSKINFVTSYMCNWEEELQGETKHFAFTYTENDQNICFEMVDERNEKQSISLSLNGFRDLHSWLEQRIEEGKTNR